MEASMRIHAVVIASVVMAVSPVQAQERGTMQPKVSTPSREDVQMVAPALDQYMQQRLLGDVGKRPGLSARDRSIVSVAAVIARNQASDMAFYFNLALDSGV